MVEMKADREDSVYCITASLITLVAVLFVVRFFQRFWFGNPKHKEEEQENSQKVESKKEEEENVDDSDIEDLLIKPEEIEELSGSPTLDDEISDDKDFRCDSLQSKLKQARHKKIKEKLEGDMTEKQIDAESKAKNDQLEAIFKLMEQSKDTFGIENMNEVKDQLKLYAIN